MSDLDVGKQTIQTEINGLLLLKDSLNENFETAVDWLFNTKGRVIITGMGKSGHIGKKITASLASLGTPTFFVHPAEASHGDLGMISEDDTILAISFSGEAPELSDILFYAKRFGIRLIGMTKGKESTLAKAADLLLLLPDAPEAVSFGMAPTTSTTMTLALGDALAVALLEKRGFTKEHYKLRHPGGKLGKQMLKVSDIMITGDRMPLVKPDMPMSEAIVVMTEKALGTLGISSDGLHLEGIISDGDLRRHMSNNILTLKTKDIMMKNPLTISSNEFAVEAVRIMHDRKNVMRLFVVDDGIIKGIISLHDLVRAGVI